ncbi:MFS transporter [Luteibacter yeojuensis]|uniref:MFS transporter n=1 Tax=Luteibacter yeojuensis TaxID=345309 RepID=A0A7X5QUT5_9GAMM|nr:MFS transporter [Luteibacter yeojuensis]NID15720.1 MFS transporter [Luteibacter yeojuensis]
MNELVETDVPARLDRLRWGRFHTLVATALGITWVLDGLEVTITGAIAGALKSSPVLHLSDTQVGLAGSLYLVGAVAGALGAVVLLDTGWLPPEIGWRFTFGLGAVLGLGILVLRRWIPESPRWLMLHGRIGEAEAIVRQIEDRLGAAPPDRPLPRLRLRPRGLTMADVASTLFRLYPKRTLLGLVLMATQAFFYNAIFFTYALVLGRFYGVADADVGLYLLPFAAGNFLGPLLLGRLFDSVGRRPMIAATYALSGLLLFATAWLFVNGWLDARMQTLAWSAVFFFASAAASSAYLTVSESFPLELRALAIALFYAFGTALGGVAGPWLFGTLIGTGERGAIGGGYALGASLMLVGAVAAWWLGLAAERRPLEDVATPLAHAENP